MSMKKYYPTAFALYMTYFVLGVAGSIMGQYKQELAGLWNASCSPTAPMTSPASSPSSPLSASAA